MSREFESLIFDPDLLDEGVDISGLRTQTETNPLLLGDVQPGVKFDPTLQSTYSDLLRFFGSGVPMLPEEGKVIPPATGTPGTGGGGQATLPSFDVDAPKNTAEDQRLIDAGIGLQDQIGDPVVALGEIPRTQDFLDQYNIAPGANVIPTDPRTMLPQMGTPQEFEFPMGGGADLATLPASPQPIDPLGRLPQLSDVVTQKDVDEPETFLEKIGLGNLDIKEAAVKAALNTAVGKPVSLLIDALGAVLPERDPRQVTLEQLYDVKDGTIQSGLMKGYNPVSGNPFNPTFGLQDAYQKRIDTIEESLNKLSKYDVTSPDYDPVKTKQQTDKLAKLKADKKTEADALGITAAEDKRLAEAEMRQTIAEAEAAIPPAATTIKDDPIEIEELGRTVITKEGPTFITKKEEDALKADVLQEELEQYKDPIMSLGDATPVDEFSDEDFMVGDTSIAAPAGGGVLGFGAQLRDDDPTPSGPPSTGFTAPTGGGADMGTVTGTTKPGTKRDDDKGSDDKGGGPCVIATHAVNSGAFTKDTKREAVRWCVKNLHRTWWGEAIRRGYRYYGQKAIDEGNAKNHYQEFKDYVAFGTGKRRTLKTAWTFIYRTVQFFIKGLFNAKR